MDRIADWFRYSEPMDWERPALGAADQIAAVAEASNQDVVMALLLFAVGCLGEYPNHALAKDAVERAIDEIRGGSSAAGG